MVSFFINRRKTIDACSYSWRLFMSILPQLLLISLIVGLIFAMVSNETLVKLLSSGNGWLGLIISDVIGAIAIIPGVIAFPLAGQILTYGAGYSVIATFISSLMMVGVITFGMERDVFGTKIATWRNVLGFILSIIIGFTMGGLMGS